MRGAIALGDYVVDKQELFGAYLKHEERALANRRNPKVRND